MQTGIISFGDRVAWNIKCNIIKDVILNELLNLYNVNNKVFVNITILMMGMFFLIGFLSPLSMIWSKQKQGWHDWWSNSIVINKQ